MKVQIYRTSASSYQEPNFFNKEKEVLEQIEGVSYIKSLNEINNTDPFILITNTHTKPENLPDVILDKTILIIHPNSGYENMSKEFTMTKNFPIVIGNPIRSHAVVEYTLSCLFHHFTKINNHLHWDDERKWNRKLLRDQKALIIGHGHVGRPLAKVLAALCKEVHIYDAHKKNQFNNPNYYTEADPEIFNGVQLLILAASLNKSSRHLINQDVFKRLDPECVIINPARGALIKEDDLIHYLQKNPKAFAYLDVFENEPFKPGYLHDLKNINKTSHIAGIYDQLNTDIINFEYHMIKEFMSYYNNNQFDQFKNDYQECILSNKLINDMLI